MSHLQQVDTQFDCLEVICFIIDESEFYCIWFSDDKTDGFLLDGSILKVFQSKDAALTFLKSFSSYKKIIKTTTYNANKIVQIVMRTIPFDSHIVLDFWNIVGDLSNSIGIPYEGNKKDNLTNSIYDKLFYGNNLPTINTSTRIYTPQFTGEEQVRLTTILKDGISLVRKMNL
ncbi:MAG: hypothetical protein SOX46_02470 [Clostridiaceae bacterium]|uniref:Uncharacterized protein n=1 Tax=Clostridium porci TaxID=2605778 RepID=A0A7X2NK83_9CLOT|nr:MULTISPECIES: hypothetical protein [Clostridium]MCI6139889.1 hypothetical protein [Clostridium sp.]MDY3230426.1 hypothetical protein [Clostridiaceae bacterium]MSS36452.1 hypothetical protein [Clostridium porci]